MRVSPLSEETPAIRTYNLCIVGFGNVGRAFVALLQKKRQELAAATGFGCRLTGIASRRLGWLGATGGFAPRRCWPETFREAQQVAGFREWLGWAKPTRCLKPLR